MSKLSPKFKLILADLKSWVITSLLMLAPIAIGQLIVYVQGQNLGTWSGTILIILGMLLKLFQKYSVSTKY